MSASGRHKEILRLRPQNDRAKRVGGTSVRDLSYKAIAIQSGRRRDRSMLVSGLPDPGELTLDQLRLLLPEYSESLLGILAPYTDVVISDADFHEMRERAWEDHVLERFGANGDRTDSDEQS